MALRSLPRKDQEACGVKPYYEDSASGIVIYHGDCREVLPQVGPVDCVITDPPYVLSDAPPGDSHYGMSLSKFESAAYATITTGFDVALTFGLLLEVVDPFNLFCFCSNKQVSEIMAWGQDRDFPTTLLVWHKPNSAPFANGVWRGDTEFCVHVRQKGAYFEGNAELKRKVVSLPCVQDKAHPTVKPLELISRYVTIGTSEGQTILDPFMGSGTTLRAAKDLGRKAIGIEIEEKYCEIAATRLQQEVLKL